MSAKKLAAIQMISGEDVEKNLGEAELLVKRAAEDGARLAVLPENFAVFDTRQLFESGCREQAEKYISSFVASLAREHKLWVVAGTIPRRDRISGGAVQEGRVRAACLVVNELGEEVARYDKIHLFDVEVGDAQGQYRESDSVEPGDRVVVVDTPVGKLGLSVCYDLRFPELFTLLCQQGAEIVTVPSAFTWDTGRAHWDILLRARAIENLCYVVGANQGGQNTPKRRTWGHSSIIDPWGTVMASIEEGPGVVSAEIDLERQRQVRERMPVLAHKKFTVVPG